MALRDASIAASLLFGLACLVPLLRQRRPGILRQLNKMAPRVAFIAAALFGLACVGPLLRLL
jgi:hypothetical protein